MTSDDSAVPLSRRGALKVTVLGTVALGGGKLAAQTPKSSATPSSTAAPVQRPGAAVRAAEGEAAPEDRLHVGRTGSDYMVDAIKTLGVEFVAINAGSSFRALHESLVNHGGNTAPEVITCLHEEVAVALAHGYAKAAGKPMMAMVHGPVGVTHASMALFNAWCDRAPVMVVAGNGHDGAQRKGMIDWIHAAQDVAAPARDFLKWDDAPGSLTAFGESLARARQLCAAAPAGPVLLVADIDLQEDATALPAAVVPRWKAATAPFADPAALADIARRLAAAAEPVIIADACVRSQAGMDALVALAEALGAPVIDRLGRLNMPSDNPLNQSARAAALIARADVILALEVNDVWGVVNAFSDLPGIPQRVAARRDLTLLSISTNTLHVRANAQDFARYQSIEVDVTADAQASLPPLLALVRAQPEPAGKAARVAAAAKAAAATRERDRAEAALGWDLAPVSLARLCAEIWLAIRDEDWVLASDTVLRGRWPNRLWSFDRADRYIGGSGGYGLGYGAPAAAGAALAHRGTGKIVVNLQPDGDLLYTPQALWTAAHHKLPLLTVMHNNRAYNQEAMHVGRMAARHSRPVESAAIGTVIDDPAIDFAMIARGFGMWSSGPIQRPEALAPALRSAVAVVKSGRPALVDVVCQPR